MSIVHYRREDLDAVQRFLAQWMPPDAGRMALLMMSAEFEPINLDCPPAELARCFEELTRVGFTESIKRIFTGDHFYRSDTGKCPRCRRYRPEVRWNSENLVAHAELCDRCRGATAEAA